MFMFTFAEQCKYRNEPEWRKTNETQLMRRRLGNKRQN